MPMGIPAGYWLYLNNYHQTEVAAQLKTSMLILQGERDYQVTMVDFGLWKKALVKNADVTFKSYPKLNHLFIEGEGPAKSTPSEYEVPSHVAGYVINDIADWIAKH
jgi:dienelactone hydrolase